MGTGARRRIDRQVAALTILLGDVAPAEFRIFAAGENSTSKGVYLFDEQAARDVMAAYQSHGIDVAIDLEHLSLEDPERSRNYDPDARGWCKLELRGGELWAVSVTWTPDGTARLTERRQRYISPAFGFNPETRRISEILNIAITSLPATDNLQPLVAASRRQKLAMGEGDAAMTPEQFAALAEALGLGADANVEDVLATVAAMVKKIQDAANGTAPTDDSEQMAAAEIKCPQCGTMNAAGATVCSKCGMKLSAAAESPAMVAAARMVTATRALVRLSGKREIGEIVREVEAWKESHVTLEGERTKLAKERAALEGSERRRLVGELVKLGAETPATAWAEDDKGVNDGKTPVKRLADEPILELRARVAKLAKAKGSPKDPAFAPGKNPGGLSEREIAMCAERKIDPAKYAATRAGIRARNATQGV